MENYCWDFFVGEKEKRLEYTDLDKHHHARWSYDQVT